MRTRLSRSLAVESLEGKQLLSTLGAMHGHGHPTGPAPVVLDGKLLVSADAVKAAIAPLIDQMDTDPTAPLHMTLPITGKVRSMGAVTGLFDVEYDPSVGPLGRGNITLQNARGSVVIGIGAETSAKPGAAGTAAHPRTTFTVVSGTGAYAGAHGAGTATGDTSNPTVGEWLLLHTTKSH